MTEIKTQLTPPSSLTDKKDSKLKKAAGALVGYGTFNVASTISGKTVSPLCVGEMRRIQGNLSKDEFNQVNVALNDALKQSGLKEKGVEFFKASARNFEEVKDIVKKEFSSHKIVSKISSKEAIENQAQAMTQQATKGYNAFFAAATNKIVLPENNKMCLATFHEMGHALNKNLGSVAKTLQKARTANVLMIPLVLISLLKDKKQDDEKPKNKFDSATDFIKKHIGVLTSLTVAPVLIEEGLATLKGNKLAAQTLDSHLLKQVKKTNALGFATYACLAAGYGIAAVCANKIRDAIVEYKKN